VKQTQACLSPRWSTSHLPDLSGLAFRRARSDDAGGLAELIRALSPTSAFNRFLVGLGEPPAELVRLLIGRDLRRGAWVAVDGDRVVGHACWAILDGAVDAGVVVADAWQGRGVGRRLFGSALADAAAAGAREVHLDVHSGNRRVVRSLRGGLPDAEITRDGGMLRFRAPLAPVLDRLLDRVLLAG